MNRHFWGLLSSCCVLSLFAIMGGVTPADAAEATGPGGTYECWDRCEPGVNCDTSCYNSAGVLTTCDAVHASCGGTGGVVGQGCGDDICWWDYLRGDEDHFNCPEDCPAPDLDHDGLPDESDNCPWVANPGQANCDGDRFGDVCDDENGTFVLFSNAGPCYIRSRLHFGYLDQTLYQEAIFRDVSSCNSPDEWRRIGENTGYCWGFWITHETCCYDLWGGGLCGLLENNQCHS